MSVTILTTFGMTVLDFTRMQPKTGIRSPYHRAFPLSQQDGSVRPEFVEGFLRGSTGSPRTDFAKVLPYPLRPLCSRQ